MVQVLHGRATTTAAVRRAIQHSEESLRALAARYGIDPKTVAKWKQRNSTSDLPTGPRDVKSTGTWRVEDIVHFTEANPAVKGFEITGGEVLQGAAQYYDEYAKINGAGRLKVAAMFAYLNRLNRPRVKRVSGWTLAPDAENENNQEIDSTSRYDFLNRQVAKAIKRPCRAWRYPVRITGETA